jgi:hypothetical protein
MQGPAAKPARISLDCHDGHPGAAHRKYEWPDGLGASNVAIVGKTAKLFERTAIIKGNCTMESTISKRVEL